MKQSVAYNMSAPSMQGCSSCGQGVAGCQCVRFDKASEQNGEKFSDNLLNDPIKHFLHYAAPINPANVDTPLNGEIVAKHSANNSVNFSMNADQSGMANAGPTF